MKINELEEVKKVVHNYLIATLTYSTLAHDLERIIRAVKVAKPYEMLLNRLLNTVDNEIKELRNEMNALKISAKLPQREVDEYFVEYTITAKGEEHTVQYARAALKNFVTDKIEKLFEV